MSHPYNLSNARVEKNEVNLYALMQENVWKVIKHQMSLEKSYI